MLTYNYSDALQHHGIKGMRWGVRRYQNNDGTLTPAGKKRYSGEGGDVLKKKDEYKQAKKEYKKSLNAAYNKADQAYSFSKKKREANDARWKDTADKAEAMEKAKAVYKQAKQDAAKSAVKKYDKVFEEASKAEDIADEKWTKANEAYIKLGKNKIERIMNAAKGTSKEAKAYNKLYEDASKASDKATEKWKEASKEYKKTGKSAVGRVVNNIRYGS